ncbi:double zinc ribbon domain-containing protein [Candidatus Parcubacteria bacterium]|nr:double zinc ribbon domain-containing protein [Candidatus Parcubacteria bacterium]
MSVTYPHLLSWLADIIFPKRCLLCREYVNAYACTSCLNTIDLKGSFSCIGCGLQVSAGRTCPFCKEECSVDQLFAATEFKNKDIQALIKAFKYQFISEVSSSLVVIMAKYIKQLARRGYLPFGQSPLLVPVPLHSYRLNWRGFNQSELIAEELGNLYQLQTEPGLLIRSAHKAAQVEIESHEERKKNSEGQFVCTRDIKGQAILLIDDVCTSGATLNECARILKLKGASYVGALVIAKG